MIRNFRRVPDTETWLEDTSQSHCDGCPGCGSTAVRRLDGQFLSEADFSGHPDVITLRIDDGQLWRAILLGLGLPLIGLMAGVALTERWHVTEPVQAFWGLIGLGTGICLARWLAPAKLKNTVEISVDEQDEK